MHATGKTAIGRLLALLTTGALVLMGTVTLSSSASAEDLEATSDDVIETIEAQPWPEYGLGDQHPDIAAAQHLLVHLGYDPHLDEDAPSEFDGETEASVRAFQGTHGLDEDGRLSGETWEALRQQTFGEFGTGSSGQVVEAVQFLLNAKFHAHLTVDGQYGPTTEGAVTESQDHFDIASDGIAGEVTWRALVTHDDHDR